MKSFAHGGVGERGRTHRTEFVALGREHGQGGAAQSWVLLQQVNFRFRWAWARWAGGGGPTILLAILTHGRRDCPLLGGGIILTSSLLTIIVSGLDGQPTARLG